MFGGNLSVTLLVEDLGRSVEFYQRVLGFTLVGYWSPVRGKTVQVWHEPGSPRRATLQAGRSVVGLRADDAGRDGSTGSAECSIEIEDLDLLHRRVRDHGGRATRPALDAEGSRWFEVSDPDGHVWIFRQRVE